MVEISPLHPTLQLPKVEKIVRDELKRAPVRQPRRQDKAPSRNEPEPPQHIDEYA